jgi:hypothetical protein
MDPNRIWYWHDIEDEKTYYMTESEILDFYYNRWAEQMIKVDRILMITEDNCIDDFVIMYWAAESV